MDNEYLARVTKRNRKKIEKASFRHDCPSRRTLRVKSRALLKASEAESTLGNNECLARVKERKRKKSAKTSRLFSCAQCGCDYARTAAAVDYGENNEWLLIGRVSDQIIANDLKA